MTELWDVWDKQQNKIIPMHPKRALHLSTMYSYRFVLSNPNQPHIEKENTMPQLPPATKALENGLHTLIALETRTTEGTYGTQEEIVCLVEGTTDTMTRVWLPHKSMKKIQQAAEVGLVAIDHANNSWEVITGARFQVFAAGGKIVAITKAGPTQITNGQTGQTELPNA